MNINHIIWIIIVLILSVLQTGWPDILRVQGVTPDLGLIMVIYFALFYGEERAMFTGLFAGIYQDIASNTALGHHILCLVITGFICGKLSGRLISEHPAIKSALVFGGAILHGILFNIIVYFQDPYTNLIYVIFINTVPSAFYSALMTPFVFWLLQQIFRFTDFFSAYSPGK